MADLTSKKVQEVFRQHHITANGLEALRQGYAKKGDYFMYEFMQAYAPESSILNSFSSGDDQLDDSSGATADKPKRTLEQWLQLIGKAGETVGGLKNNIFGGGSGSQSGNSPGIDPPAKKNTSVLIYVVAGVVLLAIGFLIFKQSKS